MKTTTTITLTVMLAAVAAASLATVASAAKKPPQLTAADRELFRYAACMRQKGVKIPNPVRGTNGKYAFPKISDKILKAPGVKKKAEACAARLPSRKLGQPTAAQQAAFKKFTDCMAKNGVKLRQPGAQGTTTIRRPPSGQQPLTGQPQRGGFFSSNDPKTKKALAKCRKYLPQQPTG